MNLNDFKGAIRDRSDVFKRFRMGETPEVNRFKPRNKNFFKEFHEKKESEEDDIELGSNSLLLDNNDRNGIEAFNSQTKIKTREKYTLPPLWVDQEEGIEENLKEINKKLRELEIQLREIKHQSLFSRNEDIPFEKVDLANQEIIKLIKTSELGLKDIMSFKIGNTVNDQIRK